MNVAVIGVGRMGQRHTQALREMGLNVVGTFDQSLEALRENGAMNAVPPALHFTDAATMLEQTRPDAVIVATTSPTHGHYTCLAAEAGVKYILCEKPMATSLAECDRMIAVCQQHGTRLAVNHQMRFMPEYAEPRAIVGQESFGGLTSITVVGGNLGMAMKATHYFEQLRFMTGEAPAEVTAWFAYSDAPNPRGPEYVDPGGSVRVATGGDKRLYIEIGVDQGHGSKVIYAGPYGQLVVDSYTKTMSLTTRRAEDRHLPSTRYGTPPDHEVRTFERWDVVQASRAVLTALFEDGAYPTGEEARLALATLVAAYVSHERGSVPARVEDANLPLDRVFPWP